MIPTRTFDYLDILKTRFPKDDIFAKYSDGKWIKVSVEEYIDASWNVACGLMAKGYRPDDKVIVICNNRPEWNFLDMGCTLARLIFVPVYSTLSEGEFLHVFNHSDAKLIILGGKSLYNKLTPIIARMDHAAEVMTIDNCGCGFCMDDLISLGKQNRGKYDPEIESNKKEVSPWVVTGGAAIRPNIIRLFTAAKLHLYQGYGMTETSPVISVNPPANNVLGTNGTPLDSTELRIADDGEILVRGQHVMKGYYKDEKATREIIDEEGWLHTGDIGYLRDGKYLMITDRKKEIFKLSSGKYIAPQMIENKLRESSFIDNCIVFGEHQKFASAIIIPNMKEVREWCARNNMNVGESDEMLIGSKEVVTILNKEVAKINKTLSEYEMIKKSFFTSDTWSVENGMLSQTLKPKRAVILSKYKAFVEAAYK